MESEIKVVLPIPLVGWTDGERVVLTRPAQALPAEVLAEYRQDKRQRQRLLDGRSTKKGKG